jgi:hypothetical protein
VIYQIIYIAEGKITILSLNSADDMGLYTLKIWYNALGIEYKIKE